MVSTTSNMVIQMMSMILINYLMKKTTNMKFRMIRMRMMVVGLVMKMVKKMQTLIITKESMQTTMLDRSINVQKQVLILSLRTFVNDFMQQSINEDLLNQNFMGRQCYVIQLVHHFQLTLHMLNRRSLILKYLSTINNNQIIKVSLQLLQMQEQGL